MLALIQRVCNASVSVDSAEIASIGPGMLVFVAVEPEDGAGEVGRMAERLLKFRLFADGKGRMNLDLAAAGGEMLLVPQFTLAADTNSGHRPSFSGLAPPELARQRFNELVSAISAFGQPVATGRFGADMQVALVNDGPVTFSLKI